MLKNLYVSVTIRGLQGDLMPQEKIEEFIDQTCAVNKMKK